MSKIRNLFQRNTNIIKLAIPIFLELILQMMIGQMDQFMMASDQTAVNAIIQANTVTNVLLISFSVLSTAAIILISQYHGAGDNENANKIYALAFYFNIVIGIVISAVLFFGARTIYIWMKVDPTVLDDAVIYMQYTGAFITLQAIITVFSAFLRANRLNVHSTVVTLIMNIMNIGLNALFIYQLQMGIKGVAIASTISRAAGLIAISIIYAKKIGVSLAPKMVVPFPAPLFKSLLKIGLPSAGENFSYNLSQVVIQIIINMSGILQGNVRGYANLIVNAVYIFASGITQAMQVEEGEDLGAEDYEKADRLVKDTTAMSMIISFFMSLLILALGYPLFTLLMGSSDDPQLAIHLALIVLTIDLVLEQGRAANIVLVRALQTAGDINYPVGLAIVSCWTVAVGGTYLLSQVAGLGVIGCWIAMAIDECFRGIVFICRWNKGNWRNIRLIGAGQTKKAAFAAPKR
jgi:putative MATE family efflux protein